MIRRLLCLALPLVAAAVFMPTVASAQPAAADPVRLVPQPSSLHTLPGQTFTLTPFARIVVPAHSPDATAAAGYLTSVLRPSTGYRLPVTSSFSLPGDIRFVENGPASLGNEGYTLTVTPLGV